METWDAILAQDSHRSLASSKNLKQLGQPVSAETQVVAGSNYRFKFADGTIVPVFESLTHVFKIDDFKRATDIGSSYCTYAPDYDCYPSSNGFPACCQIDMYSCPEKIQECEGSMMTGGWEKMSEREMMETWDAILAQDSHRSLASSKNLKQLGQPVSAETQVVAGSNYRFKFADGTIVPVFESLTHVFKIDDFKRATGNMGRWEKNTMSEREMVEKWDAVLAEESTRDLVSSKILKQFGEPVSVETQVVEGTNYRFTFADGTIVTVWETLNNIFKIEDVKRATQKDVHYFSFNASAATNNGLILFLAVIGICMTLFYGVQYTRKLFQQDYTAIKEEV